MGVTFFTGSFCFHVVKSLTSILTLMPTLFNFKKNSGERQLANYHGDQCEIHCTFPE